MGKDNTINNTLENIAYQRDGLRKWLKEFTQIEDQKFLDEGTPERLYWHYGRMVALTDVLVALGYEKRPE